MQSDNIVELDEVALATGKLQPVTNIFSNPNGAHIGDNFPEGGYGNISLKAGLILGPSHLEFQINSMFSVRQQIP